MVLHACRDWLARSTAELLAIAERLNQKEAGLQSLDKPWADTLTPSGRMVLTVFAGMAEFERALKRGLFAVLGVGLLR
jgi:DNA invertase Pin-like site-specific DNA recombinase